MRELGATGFMSNRGRQNVASLLAKASPRSLGLGSLAAASPGSELPGCCSLSGM